MSFVPLFTQHSRTWRDNRYVYPVVSRRSKGISIGVNLNPDKVCNFDCIYCSVDRSSPVAIAAHGAVSGPAGGPAVGAGEGTRHGSGNGGVAGVSPDGPAT